MFFSLSILEDASPPAVLVLPANIVVTMKSAVKPACIGAAPTLAESASPLPSGWQSSISNGRVFYFNQSTGESTFERPQKTTDNQTNSARPRAQTVSYEWRAFRDSHGRIYYNNVLTNETTWTKPEAYPGRVVTDVVNQANNSCLPPYQQCSHLLPSAAQMGLPCFSHMFFLSNVIS